MPMMIRLLPAILLPVVLLATQVHVNACQIQGTNSGFCTKRYLPSSYGSGIKSIELSKKQWLNGTEGECIEGKGDHCMSFCGKHIASYYPPCVPAVPSISVRNKDRWVQQFVAETIETHTDLFLGNKDCNESFERYVCWANFPRCDDNEQSLPMCISVCENFLRACRLESDLYDLCNNGLHVAEDVNDTSSNVARGLVSTLFPGEPFRQNEFIPRSRGQPAPICTPSIKNAAEKTLTTSLLALGILLLPTFALIY